jgi:ABC-2 type transport system ATP-binding protein
MKDTTILSVKNLTKTFGNFTAVDNLSFTIKEGEVLGLLGQNGAGKTTTIQMLLGVTEASGGTIAYFGKPLMKHREEILKKINFSSTYISMPWLFTIEEILEIYARLYEVPDRKKRIEKLTQEFEIDHLRKKQFFMLSAGEKTRLLLTKAFLNYPKLILLDEPTASLDPDIAVKIREFLKKEKAEYNLSMLFTSHNMAEVEEICDQVMILKSGKVVDADTPENLAKKMRHTQIEFLFAKDHVKAKAFLEKKNIPYQSDERRFVITIEEKAIAQFLQLLAKEQIVYEEISINKPTLEEYFLETVNKGGTNES